MFILTLQMRQYVCMSMLPIHKMYVNIFYISRNMSLSLQFCQCVAVWLSECMYVFSFLCSKTLINPRVDEHNILITVHTSIPHAIFHIYLACNIFPCFFFTTSNMNALRNFCISFCIINILLKTDTSSPNNHIITHMFLLM